MAKMGTRKVKRTSDVEGAPFSLSGGVNVFTSVLHVDLAGVVTVGSTLGIPIMREGFITDTDFLPSSEDQASLVTSA
jgi:hypothetical protein